jgi:hypothetical protein
MIKNGIARRGKKLRKCIIFEVLKRAKNTPAGKAGATSGKTAIYADFRLGILTIFKPLFLPLAVSGGCVSPPLVCFLP